MTIIKIYDAFLMRIKLHKLEMNGVKRMRLFARRVVMTVFEYVGLAN